MGALRKLAAKMRRGDTRIGRRMYAMYTLAVLIPLAIAGMLLIVSANKTMTEHYLTLLESDNRRVRTLLSEIATQAYNISADVCFDNSLKRLLVADYETGMDYINEVNGYERLDEVVYSAQEIKSIHIYTDNPTIQDYKQFRRVTPEIAQAQWYQEAVSGAAGFWVSIPEVTYTDERSNLCLVRRITLSNSNYHAVAVIRVSDPYIRARIDTSGIVDAVSLDAGGIVYSSRRNWYANAPLVDIDYSDPYYRYSGRLDVEGETYFVTASVTHLHMTNSVLYVTTMDMSGIAELERVRNTWVLILLLAIVVPGIILAGFAGVFAARVNLLREEMHKARNQDYNIISTFSGNDELTEAFEDLKVMVQDIKDKDARMYQSELKENELRSRQQIMEYKMLASQINPHYLYNTLETIRMKALSTGSRDVAASIKILGKTLHYVLENTGTAFTTLRRELEHVENYLSIQKLRFGDRIGYEITTGPGLDADSYRMLPLLLQPVVENAVVHGLEDAEGPGLVRLEAALEDSGDLRITVSDSGRGMTEDELQRIRAMLASPEKDPQSGIALHNINQRIRLSCGDGFGIAVESEYGVGTRVILTLPREFTL